MEYISGHPRLEEQGRIVEDAVLALQAEVQDLRRRLFIVTGYPRMICS